MHDIVLYWHPMSSATPIACALAELAVPHQRVKVDITTGEQRRPDFLALNPNGKVPTLTVDGAPMFEALASFNSLEHLCNQAMVPPTGAWGYARQLDPDRQPMATSDGWISVAPYVDARWQRFFDAVGRPDVFQRPTLATKDLRRTHMSEMYREMAAILPGRSTADWLALFKRIEVPAMAVQTVGDLPADPHLQAVGLFQPRQHPTEGGYLAVRQPVRFGGSQLPTPGDAPNLGQHSDELLRELGLSPTEPPPT